MIGFLVVFFLYVISTSDIGSIQLGDRLIAKPESHILMLLMAFVLFEAIALWISKRTVGKMLYGIRLYGLTHDNAFRRATLVWWRGMGTGFPLVSIFTGCLAYGVLTRQGATTWDRELGIEVVFSDLSGWRWLFIWAVWIIVLAPVEWLVLHLLKG